MDKAHISKNYGVCQGKITTVEVYFWGVNLNEMTFCVEVKILSLS
jgi:hypothetical protein